MKPAKLYTYYAMAALSLFPVLQARAEISQVSLSVEGLGCPFCVYGLEKKLKKVEWVEDLRIDLKSGMAVMTPEEGKTPDLSAFNTAVKKAGFTPGEMKITAVGKVVFKGKGAFLKLRNADREYHLFDKGVAHAEGLTQATRARLADLEKDGTVVAITGSVHEHADEPAGLSVDQVEEVKTTVLSIEGMTCELCADRLARLLEEKEGVSRTSVSFAAKRAEVESLGRPLDPALLIKTVEGAGFQAALVEKDDE